MHGELQAFLPPGSIKINEPMRNHTTFRIGGPVDIMVLPTTISELMTTVRYCRQKNIPFFILGMGSNILVRDKGIRGLAIKIGNNFKEIKIIGNEIYAQAGASLSEVAYLAAVHSLAGFEFAEGIPGSLGGAVVMNAGAYDGEMKEVVVEVEAISTMGDARTFTGADIGYGYRQSVFQHNGYIVTAAKICLQPGVPLAIKEKMKQYSDSRRTKQPLEYPSAGSIFRRPPGHYVGPMIEELGLKGFSMGGAQISTKHAGFIVNTGHASAADVLELIEIIIKCVHGYFGVELHPEIRIMGEE